MAAQGIAGLYSGGASVSMAAVSSPQRPQQRPGRESGFLPVVAHAYAKRPANHIHPFYPDTPEQPVRDDCI